MDEKAELNQYLYDLVGTEGCGVSCGNADILHDEEGWKLMMEGFMEPWKLGRTITEAKASLKEYVSQGFGIA
ncbi:hypothetical protein [Desulfoferrobacter suflitae]|uniref:hypothetical protein n=1 Tax=Desulfoferrobacter suflitae TaxID=2865782 RepID=UPI0021647841|nr:hypothetical protein [Desulfoferrobacter suflitae]MCK8602084.1 hypothetical protein [Desulfoferrobacter suflitae]